MNYLKIKKLSTGKLLLTIADSILNEAKDDYYHNDNFEYDLFEQYSSNGGYTLFDPSNGNPFIGLTNAPCVAESLVDIDDWGTLAIQGDFWYYPDYQTTNWVELLVTTGRVEFKKGS